MIVAALAGRRVDAEGSSVDSFPAANVSAVQKAIGRVFIEERIELLVCSCAAGADILALQVAEQMHIDRRVILPFDIDRFRATSVVDRSDTWGASFDSLIEIAERSGQLRIIAGSRSDAAAFTETNRAIVKEAVAAAYPTKPVSILVWDGHPRSSADYTNEFRQFALQAGMRERVVPTR